MAKFRKKPVVIEAVRFVDRPREIEGPEPAWYMAARTMDRDEVGAITYVPAPAQLSIHTLEGDMLASVGDWIIKGVKGELYPCKPDIFEATYEAADEEGEDDDREICETCSKPLASGDLAHRCADGPVLCEECSPTWADVLAQYKEPDGDFGALVYKTPEEATEDRAVAQAHVDAGDGDKKHVWPF